MAVAPASTKTRKTKVAIAWYFDPFRKEWRFAPVDTAHRAVREQKSPDGEPIQGLRSVEAKGWVPAAIAVRSIPESHQSMPEPVKAMFPKAS